MLRYLPKRTTPIRVQPLPRQGHHPMLLDSALVGQQHSSGVRDLSAAFRGHITLTPYFPLNSSIPTFQGLIPGGQSFQIPRGEITTVDSQGTGFSWIPSVRAGSTVIIAAGDDRGRGNGGSAPFIVGYGDNSCLNDNSPSSTPGSPAGGSYPTSSSGQEANHSSGFVIFYFILPKLS